ncbi:MAG: PepSY domain-containing protein [FCB group bacterium]|nr:PepSY domain-containing protein [FCB group bacterium]
MASLRTWRIWHRNILGYFRWLTVSSALFIFLIAVTGILLEHKNDFHFLQTSRIPANWLPNKYTERLLALRAAQGATENANVSIPLSWVVYDLHSGDILGPAGVIYYDLVAAAMGVLSITGIWMFIVVTKKRRLNK